MSSTSVYDDPIMNSNEESKRGKKTYAYLN